VVDGTDAAKRVRVVEKLVARRKALLLGVETANYHPVLPLELRRYQQPPSH
jgi:hypothetical protein